MAKSKVLYECQSCGYQSGKWLGKCPNCGAWESFLELSKLEREFLKSISKNLSTKSSAISITDIKEEHYERFSSNDSELDLVLGGGIVKGSLTLIGGSPGVGKSTLLLKIASNIAQTGKKVLYVSGEESLGQIKLRANRLDANSKNLFMLSQIELEKIFEELQKRDYELLIIDSIQTIYSNKIPSAPGSVSQVRDITFNLLRVAKDKNLATFIIGHITKEGSIAGPRVLEHMVDTVLYFEGDSNRELRLLRGFKNRFGSTSEVAIFEMTKKGLISAKDISKKFFTRNNNTIGSALTVILEGSRPLIVEVQALVSKSSYPSPKRSSTGYEQNRLNMLLALLEKKLSLPLNEYDVFINISGGIKISETSADLAIVTAIVSSFRDRAVSKDTLFLGEVSLTGEVREVFNQDIRLKEAIAQDFKRAIVPKLPLEDTKLKCYEVSEVSKLIDWM